jgi:ATP-binding cassette subfamily B (MDR/TAP) protein 1
MIAHKLSTVEKADKIIVMDQGCLVEEGTHHSLLAKKGLYYNLFHAQSLNANSALATATSSSQQEEEPLENEHQLVPIAVTLPQPLNSISISRRYSLLHCIFTILHRTPHSIPYFLLGTAVCFVAGGAFPLQAYLFSKLVTIFQLSSDPAHMISRANFWSLMFFMLALSNLLSYATLWLLFAVSGSVVSRKYRPAYLGAMLEQPLLFQQIPGNESGALTTLLATDGDDLEILIGM